MADQNTSIEKKFGYYDWLSAGNSSHLKHSLFSTFHRVLDELTISVTRARILMIIQFMQLSAIIINDTNPILTIHIP